jgi:KaiC protein
MSENQQKKAQRLSSIVVGPVEERFSTGIQGLDSCLAESDDGPVGMPYGTSVLISGAPGGGKSTVVTYICNAQTNREALYLHGEERAERVRRRWDRLKLEGTDPFLAELRHGEDAADVIRDVSLARGLGVCVTDSIQCLIWQGSRKYQAQFEAAEHLMGLVCSNGGVWIGVSQVDKTGKSHKGAAELAHVCDIHLHLTSNTNRNERYLEVRKNRVGRAGFRVPVNITISGISVGTPAPLAPGSGLVQARTALEKATEKAYELLMEGRSLNGYDFDEAGVNGGIWRAGLSTAVKRLERDGFTVESTRVKGRMTWTLDLKKVAEEKDEGPAPTQEPPEEKQGEAPSPTPEFPVELY